MPSADEAPDALKNPDPPSPSQPDTARLPRGLTVLVLVTALVVVLGAYVALRSDDAVDVVEDFFAALVAKDVEGALEKVGRIGYGVPYGERAAFLHPDAIADGWRLLDAEFVDSGIDTYVEVTIGDEESRTSGRLEVTDFGGEWNIVDPFVEVEFSATAFTYLAVNDRQVVWSRLHEHYVGGMFAGGPVELLPGRYNFFGAAAGTTGAPAPAVDLLPPDDDRSDPLKLSPPAVALTPETAAAVQAQGDALLDDCARFTTPNPHGCPFGIGDVFARDERNGVYDLHDIEWEVLRRPALLVDGTLAGDPPTGMAVTTTDPGLVRLTATGEIDGDDVRFTADCVADTGSLRVALRPDGTPELYDVGVFGPFGFQLTGEIGTCVYKGEV
ncbi:hypothetical protein AB0I28_02560 [Phytomonospora sp. NPDC050363]|uniref:hypothetical protein n=1 Tax=Phytomonospora sp. NPDC050363 TaxID=3155642 RepID=UPI0033D2C210